ncbi:hypothetical protein GGR58DRAFT_524685 [Xylaria digitata]|nr:hypothetical protein GGR58DRAFT_524685 [Xylaria digitata]
MLISKERARQKTEALVSTLEQSANAATTDGVPIASPLSYVGCSRTSINERGKSLCPQSGGAWDKHYEAAVAPATYREVSQKMIDKRGVNSKYLESVDPVSIFATTQKHLDRLAGDVEREVAETERALKELEEGRKIVDENLELNELAPGRLRNKSGVRGTIDLLFPGGNRHCRLKRYYIEYVIAIELDWNSMSPSDLSDMAKSDRASTTKTKRKRLLRNLDLLLAEMNIKSKPKYFRICRICRIASDARMDAILLALIQTWMLDIPRQPQTDPNLGARHILPHWANGSLKGGDDPNRW